MSARAEQGRFDGLVPPTASDAGLNAPSDTMLTGIPSTTTRATSPCCAGDATCSSMEGLTSSESWRERTSRELYERGGIRPYYSDDSCIVLLGDCRELLPLISGVGAVVSDPPYGMDWDGKVSRGNSHGPKGAKTKSYGITIAGDNEPFDPAPFLGFPHVVLFGSNHYSQRLPVGTTLVWVKRLDAGFGSFLSDAEIAWRKGGHGVYCFRDLAMQSETRTRQHPTQKPVGLMKWCIEQSGAHPESLILDPYMGSGTTLRAAKDLGRKAIGIEIEERYCEIAAKRLSQAVLPLEIPA